MERRKKVLTALDTAFTSHYRDPESYHDYVLERGRGILASHLALLIRSHVHTPQPKVLDLAAGTGIISAALAKAGFKVTATDADAAMLATLSKKIPQVSTQQFDINRAFPVPAGYFDAATTVWANRYITHDGLESFIHEVHTALKPDGVFVWPIFGVDRILWKLRTGLTQPTSPRALARRLSAEGFVAVHIDDSQKRQNKIKQEIANWTYPVYIVARKES